MTAPVSPADATALACADPARKAAVLRFNASLPSGSPGALNAIDYIEVLDEQAPPGTPRQRTLLVHCLRGVAALERENVLVEGGVRIRDVGVEWARAADRIVATPGDHPDFPPLAGVLGDLADQAVVLVVRTTASGDFSTYTLRLIASPLAPEDPPPGFDRRLASASFSFRVECDTGFDCRTEVACPSPVPAAPAIDYLSKDFASFRRLMLDRLAITAPEWRDDNAADLKIALVELLAYAGDRLSYFQDAVATEAYLGTARRRTSVRRHARLIDYVMHDGSNARAWVAFTVAAAADGLTLRGAGERTAGAMLLTRTDAAPRVLAPSQVEEALALGAEVFETLADVTLRAAHNEIRIHDWADAGCCLPRGATRATLRATTPDGPIALGVGDLLLLEEVRGAGGRTVDADSARRHVVRLTAARTAEDPLFREADGVTPLRLLEVTWAPADALPFALVVTEEGSELARAVARANVTLADHGRTLPARTLSAIAGRGKYRPVVATAALTQQGRVRTADGAMVPVDPAAPAARAFDWQMRDVLAAITLQDDAGLTWHPQRDLLGSDRFAPHFVVEPEEDGRTRLRFGDGIHGRQPGGQLDAAYRVGNGHAGNVGADAIAHLVASQPGITAAGVLRVRNPLPARGGIDPEPLERVRLVAPQAFRTQERAITEQDYAEVAERHPEVQRAAATRRWTGSWYTMFVTIDRLGGREVDAAFEAELRAHLERFRLAGHDVEIDAPRFVPLDVELAVCVAPGYFRGTVKAALLQALGRDALFHPDNFTFGQPVYLSRVVTTAMGVPGVASVDVTKFQRWGRPAGGELAQGQLSVGRLEIARLDNDANLPENGRLTLNVAGGV